MKRPVANGLLLAGRFRHFFRRLMSLARQDLQKLPQHQGRSIHRLRTRMKKLAAVLRLVKSRMRREEYRKALVAAKRLKNAFAQQRDAEVAAKLLEKKHPDLARKIPMSQKAGAPLFIEIAILERLLSDAALENLSQEDILTAYVKCYHKGRKRMKKCLKKPMPELLHEWRGPVKKFFYQSLLMTRAKGAEHRIAHAKKLGKWLGKDHDQHLLADQARKDRQFQIAEALDANRAARQQRIFKLARKLYKAPPRELWRKLEKHLK